mmetsp:Transcript_100082/g.305955  ORF Transcript_100082/g.305955 Transcript_100082/m.305955 type:complete len:212 (+) Transcript_100082:129-764(+)
MWPAALGPRTLRGRRALHDQDRPRGARVVQHILAAGGGWCTGPVQPRRRLAGTVALGGAHDLRVPGDRPLALPGSCAGPALEIAAAASNAWRRIPPRPEGPNVPRFPARGGRLPLRWRMVDVQLVALGLRRVLEGPRGPKGVRAGLRRGARRGGVRFVGCRGARLRLRPSAPHARAGLRRFLGGLAGPPRADGRCRGGAIARPPAVKAVHL